MGEQSMATGNTTVFLLALLAVAVFAGEPDILETAARFPRNEMIRLPDGTWRKAEYGDAELEQAWAALRDIPAPWSVTEIAKRYEVEKDAARRVHLLHVLAASQDPRAGIVLGNALTDSDLDVRVAATRGIIAYFALDPVQGSGGAMVARRWWETHTTRDEVAAIKALPEKERASAIVALHSRLPGKEPAAEDARHARLVLIGLGDQDTIDDTLRHFRHDRLPERWCMMGVLKQSSQPKLVPALMRDVEREENATSLHHSEDEPLSVIASELIGRIIQNVPDYSPAVKTWAVDLSRKKPAEMRDQVRRWWAQNEESIINAKYDAVKPPAD